MTTSQNTVARPRESACEKGSFERLAPTAALVSVQGRVKTSSGTGIRNAIVEVNGGTLTNPIRGRTNSFGYFRFTNLEVGQTYIITVQSKSYAFSNPTRVISLSDNINDFDFVATED